MRPRSPARPVYIAAAIAALTACNDASHITEPNGPLPVVASEPASAGTVVPVADVEPLYAAVNDPANAGATILLAPGTFVLSATDASGADRPNAGRLELQQDMSVSGVAGHRDAVIIDAAALTASSFSAPFGRTGVIRAGRGSNAVEWLTIAGNPLAAAAVETDLVSTPTAQLRVAHVVAGNSARGVDIRNVGAPMAGRRIDAEIVDSEFFRGVEGIRVANFLGADHGDISVVMSGNRSYQNILGCIVEHNRSSFATIYVRSSGDRFEDNGLGCQIGGGLAVSPGAANSTSTIFECSGTHFINNTRTSFFNNTGPDFTEFGGLLVVGGDAVALTGTTSSNTLLVRLSDCMVAENQNIDFQAFGARSGDQSRVSGVHNQTTIELHGFSTHIDVVGVDSSPVDPSGSNTVTIIR